MISTEVKRTLVKSPPELWSELSDQDSLARHFSELGEVRITHSEPEQLVEWEAEHARGRVQIKASGWGTKVTLNVTRELPSSPTPERQPSSQAPELEQEPTPEPQTAAEGEHGETQPSPSAQTQSENAGEDESEPLPSEPMAPTLAEPEPLPAAETPPEPAPRAEPRRGFFARLFKRRRAPDAIAAVEPTGEPATSSDLEPVEDPQLEPSLPFQALAAPEPIYPDPPPKPADPPADITAELAVLEAQIELDTTELLTAILDRLGAAHHRPFSRA